MLIAIDGVKLYAHTFTWTEALCSLLYIECSIMLIAIHGVKLYAHCHTCSDAL